MKRLLVMGGILLSVTLTGCIKAEKTYIFEGDDKKQSEIEDILGDRMEVENPNVDIDVKIYEED